MASARNQKGKRMWPSLAMANHVADWANGFFIVSLVVGVVSSFLIVWMAGVKEAYWERDRTESAERIASLSKQGEQLRKDTAEANARAIEARVELEKFKAPRSLTVEQKKNISDKLEKFAGTPFDFSVNPQPEPQELMGQIGAALLAAKWKWQSKADSGGLILRGRGNSPSAGIMTSFSGLAAEIDIAKISEWGPALSAFVEAMAAENIPVRGNAATDGSAPPDAIHIYVGIKK